MLAADTSTLIALFAGETGKDVDQALEAIKHAKLCLPPFVLIELLSAPNSEKIETQLLKLPLIELKEGFYERAGKLRRGLLRRGRKAGIGDVMIAQACVDEDLPLITRDQDFSAIAKMSGLRIQS